MSREKREISVGAGKDWASLNEWIANAGAVLSSLFGTSSLVLVSFVDLGIKCCRRRSVQKAT